MFRFVAGLIISLFLVNTTFAGQLKNSYGDWYVMEAGSDKDRVCYAASLAKKQDGNFVKREDPYILVSKFSDRKPEVSISGGFDYKKGSRVELDLGSKKYTLNKIKGHLVWADKSSDDLELIMSLKAGSKLIVRSEAEQGNSVYAIDEYSLAGFTDAYKEVVDNCNKAAPQPAKVEPTKVEPTMPEVPKEESAKPAMPAKS